MSMVSAAAKTDWSWRRAKADVGGVPSADTPVDDIMHRHPTTIRIFLDFRMKCVGCPIACVHTVDDACREHRVDRETIG